MTKYSKIRISMYNINIVITFHDPQYKYIICMYTSEKAQTENSEWKIVLNLYRVWGAIEKVFTFFAFIF